MQEPKLSTAPSKYYCIIPAYVFYTVNEETPFDAQVNQRYQEPSDLGCDGGWTRGPTFQKFWGAPKGTAGGLEIVFNQQLTRLGKTSLTASLPQAQRYQEMVLHSTLYLSKEVSIFFPYGTTPLRSL